MKLHIGDSSVGLLQFGFRIGVIVYSSCSKLIFAHGNEVFGSIFSAKDWASSKCKLCGGTYDDNTTGVSTFHTYLQATHKIDKY